MFKKGFFIVLEGTDGSGKTVQLNLLMKKLKKLGFSPQVIDFPRYGKPSAYFVENYLRGKYGGWQEVSPYQASFFYTLDRYEVAPKIRKWIKEKKIILANRYTASNLGHQGAKIKSRKKRFAFFKWLYNLEYKIFNLPKPDLNIILHMPAKIAFKLIEKKEARNYLKGKKRDIHEQDLKYLYLTEKSYLEAARFFPKDFFVIKCFKKTDPLSISEISQKVWKVIEKRFLR